MPIMKRTAFIFLCISFICINSYSQENTLKVITYNIWNGYDWGKDEDRRAQVNTWINDQNPSIVALQELCKYTSNQLEKDAKTWGHDYAVLLKKSGYSVGLTSKYPIEIKESRLQIGSKEACRRGAKSGTFERMYFAKMAPLLS